MGELQQPNQQPPDSKSIQEYASLSAIANNNGWLIYQQHLNKLIDNYTSYMDNIQAPADLLKNYQLIRKGLELARDIPKQMELRAKTARKVEKRKEPSRIKNFFTVGQ